MSENRYEGRIVSDPAVMAGKPVVNSTRIPVERVLQHLAHNPDLNDLFEAFPHLTIDEVKACFAYTYSALRRERQQVRSTAG